MRLTRTIALGLYFVLVAFVVLPAQPAFAWSRGTDDDCKGLYPTPYFWAEGPSNYWHTNAGGVSNCHMWTTTIDVTLNFVNRAWWYTDPGDPSGTGYANAYMPGTDNSCGSVRYNLMPAGEYGANDPYWVSQAGPASPYVFQGVFLQPGAGAKLYEADNQACPVNSGMSVDYLQWNE